jgi:structural maintenance of chromosome 2
MHLSEICLEGFKSYAQRTVISGWDQEFNAITGLNGSGKSNILDAICFVLGISNLSQVRATNLQDLVYKQGQAGINKATVSLVFDNRDPKLSPIGYEHKETIEVTRQVSATGGQRREQKRRAPAQRAHPLPPRSRAPTADHHRWT